MFSQLHPNNRYTKPPLGVRVDPLHSLAPFNAWLLNEGAGTQLVEAVHGDASIAAQNGGPTWIGAQSDGGYGSALRFVAASKQWIDLSLVSTFFAIESPRNLLFAGTNNEPFTIAALFRTSTVTTNAMTLYSATAISGTNASFTLAMNSTGGRIQAALRDDVGTLVFAQFAAGANDGKWHWAHAVSYGSGQAMILFIDGVSRASTTNNPSSSSTFGRARIGSGTGGSGSAWWDGDISALFIWRRALADGEVRSHVAAPFQPFLTTRPLQPSLLPTTAVIDRRTGNFRAASRIARGGL